MTNFQDRQGTNLNRRKLKIISQSSKEIIADIEREETEVTNQGTPLTADTFNSILAEKQNVLIFDGEPMEGSNNPMTSGGIYTALQSKVSESELPLTVSKGGTGVKSLPSGYALVGNGTGAVSNRSIIANASNGSTSLITSGGVYSTVNNLAYSNNGKLPIIYLRGIGRYGYMLLGMYWTNLGAAGWRTVTFSYPFDSNAEHISITASYETSGGTLTKPLTISNITSTGFDIYVPERFSSTDVIHIVAFGRKEF